MSEEQPGNNETTYRIRAAVRALMSPGMWLVVVSQVVTLVLFSLIGEQEGKNQATPVYAMFSFFVFLFLTTGMFQSLARGSSVVSAREVIANAPPVFGRFLLLGLKVFFLFLFVFYFAILVIGGGMDVLKAYPWMLGMSLAVIAVVLAYWLPIVFVTGRFELILTLTSAIQMQRKRLSQLPFIAILLLTPNILGLFLSLDQVFAAAIIISVLSEILGWIAYTYCIEYVVRHRNEALIAASV